VVPLPRAGKVEFTNAAMPSGFDMELARLSRLNLTLTQSLHEPIN
jgi:hypothetical protein